MKKRLFAVTIDAEADCTASWKKSEPLAFDSISFGIPDLLRPIWDKHGINPTYFVSPEVLMDENCSGVLKEELAKGAEIGAHLHSEYIEPEKKYAFPGGTICREFPCYANSEEIEYKKIWNLTRLIRKKIGIKPVSYRAGRFGADLDTIESLAKLGYKIDSSITPHVDWTLLGGPDHSHAPEQPYWISEGDYYKEETESSRKILEVPVTIGRKRFGLFGKFLPDNWYFYNWLRPSLSFFFEQKSLINEFERKFTDPTLAMMFHSIELMPKKSPYSKTKKQADRILKVLKKTIEYAEQREYEFVSLRELLKSD